MVRSLLPRRQKRRRMGLRPIVWAAIAGATLEYFWDPDKGTRRRAIARDQFRATLRQTLVRSGKRARYLRGEAYGVAERTVHLHPPDNPEPDDNTLKDRVESILFRDWSVPKGDLNINVIHGIVELRGQVDHQEEVTELEEKVQSIAGVQGVHSYLHLPNTPAPNKARVLTLSQTVVTD